MRGVWVCAREKAASGACGVKEGELGVREYLEGDGAVGAGGGKGGVGFYAVGGC